MTDCQPLFFSFEPNTLTWIASHIRYQWLTPVMMFFSNVGQVGPILFILSFSYWLWNKRIARALCYGLFADVFLNLWIKSIVKECRPDPSYWLETVDSFSFPSGHAQISVYMWFGLAFYVKERLLSFLFILIGLAIAFSRNYLGVHFPHDVLIGGLLGLIVLIITIWCVKKEFRPLHTWPFWARAIVLIMFLGIYQYFVNDPRGAEVGAIGACAGFWFGCQFENKQLNFSNPRNLLAMLKQLIIGSIGLILFYKGGNILGHQLSMNVATIVKYIQYFIIGLWIAYGAPATLHYLRRCRGRTS